MKDIPQEDRSLNPVSRDDRDAYVTLDGSIIRELINPATSLLAHQSLAEATLCPGQVTATHYHVNSDEIYYLIQGNGEMSLNGHTFAVNAGDSIAIPAGAKHCIANTGTVELRLLCCCAPPYRHDDTIITTT